MILMNRKGFKWTGLLAGAALLLGACGGEDNQADKQNNEQSVDQSEITVGASNTPHAEILEFVQPILAEEGIDLKIETYSDYVIPNVALSEGDIDANYFQHIPFFEEAVAENDYDFVNLGAIHLEPMGAFSKRHDSLEDLPEGATILSSNSITDHGRIISILQEAGLVTVKEGVDLTTATFDDIAENPKNLEFDYEYEPALMPTLLEQDEGDVIFINSNFAVDHDIDPINDSIALESTHSPYANMIAARSEDKDNAALKRLVEVLKSDEVADFIQEKWSGAVLPVQD